MQNVRQCYTYPYSFAEFIFCQRKTIYQYTIKASPWREDPHRSWLLVTIILLYWMPCQASPLLGCALGHRYD